jgi:uroporphyrinogen-III synthase
VLEVRALAPVIALAGVHALAFTSANAVRAFAGLEARRDLPVFAVGGATAEAARAAGFGAVEDAAGDVQALADHLIARRPGRILHPAAAEPAGDLAGLLTAAGVPAQSVVIYDTVAVRPDAALAGLGALDAVLIHSPKAGRRVAALVAPAEAPDMAVIALSAAAARPLRDAGFADVRHAQSPSEAALLALLTEKAPGP